MTIIFPILLAAVAMGLSLRRMTPVAWCALAIWIAGVIAYHYVKG